MRPACQLGQSGSPLAVQRHVQTSFTGHEGSLHGDARIVAPGTRPRLVCQSGVRLAADVRCTKTDRLDPGCEFARDGISAEPTE